jgi:hypothetical protein
MRLSLNPRPTPTKEATPPPYDVPFEKPDKPLEFWYIKPHDRKTLIESIMPYMAKQLPKKYLLQTVLDRQTWAGELLRPEFTEAVGHDLVRLHETTAAFWTDPTTMIAELLRLTRLWFFTLLRYTYRTHFIEGHTLSRSDLGVLELCTSHNHHYNSELTEHAIHRLASVPNKYGASFYRNSYKDAKQCVDWISFCAKIRALCRSFGLYTLSENPEKNLQDLRHNITPITMHRKWLQICSQLNINTVMVRNTKRDVEDLDERISTGTVHVLDVVEETRRVIPTLQSQLDELRLLYPLLDELRQQVMEFPAELKRCRMESDKESKHLCSSIEESILLSKSLIASLREEVNSLRNGLNTPNSERLTAEALLICRWLLEHLPAAELKREGFGYRWRQFWQSQWSQCEQNMKHQSHPLWELVRDAKYNKVGKNLYGTLSNGIHGYGKRQGDRLHPDVQRVLDAIKPVHYSADDRIDLEAERKRWLSLRIS